MKFLHTADWQIGRLFERFGPEDGPALAAARINTVERIAQLAAVENFGAVLVAGDVFDTQTVSDRTIRRLFNATRGFTGPWIMIPGNHDAALAESVWTRAQRLNAVPANVHLVLTPEVLEFPDIGFAVLPAPLTQRHTHEDLTEWFDSAETTEGLLRIGVAHGSVQGLLAEDIDSANPIAADRAARAGLDYLALGDWHGTKQIDPRTWYSGTPEQDRFKDNGAGQVLAVEVAEPGAEPSVTPIPMGQYDWVQWRQTLNVLGDVDQLIGQLKQLEQECVLNLVLDGQVDLLGEQRLQEALSEAEGRHRSLITDMNQLRLYPTDEDITALHADGYVGEVIEDLRELQDGEQADVAKEALAILASTLRDVQPEGEGA